jgi:hypothetical protein
MALDRENVVRKIQAMLKLAQDSGASEGEINVALQKAHKLLEKYDLSMSDVELKTEVEDMVTVVGGEFTRTYQWIWDISRAIDKLCNTKCIRFGRGWHFRMTFCGTRTDTATAISMFQFLFGTIQVMGKRARLPGIKERNSYCNGVGRRILNRVHEMTREETPETEQTTAIVLVKNQAVEKYAEETHNIHTIKPPTVSKDTMAYIRGFRDGKRVPLSTTKALPK